MSDSFLRVIPSEPAFVPSPAAASAAVEALRQALPCADAVEFTVTGEVRFVDPGGLLESIYCPACGAALDQEWWAAAMESAHGGGFTSLAVFAPCCSAPVSLNGLRYDWPAGFARFVLEARNPGVASLEPETVDELRRTLGCELRLIWARL